VTQALTKVSVIIPSRNRAGSLAALLDSLARAEQPAGAELEIVVVDNGSTDGTAAMLEKRLSGEHRYPLRALSQPVAGKSNALNLALADCGGDLIAIFDDDVTVESKCLVKLVEALRASEYAAMQGRILPGVDADGRSADAERLSEYNIPLIDYGGAMREIRALTGTNIAFTRELLNAVGHFDPRLGPGAAGFSEDTEFSIRIRKAGFKIGYTPDAVVYHELNPVRYGRDYNRQVEYRKGLSRSVYRQDSMAFNVVPNLLANCVRLVFYRLLGLRQKAYKTEGRLYKCLGYMAGKWRRVASAK
jgi:glycosyltransferase involved in cell wall biosynthesis